jgi:HEAT repeat protein
MKKHVSVLCHLLFIAIANGSIAQSNSLNSGSIPDREWSKNPATNAYSLESDTKTKSDLTETQRNKILMKWDSVKVFQGLSSSDSIVRMNSVRILGWIPNNSKIGEVKRLLLVDPSIEVRVMCDKSLALLGDKNSLGVLTQALKDKDRTVELEAAVALASLGEKQKSFQFFRSLWNTADRHTKLQINLSLLNMGTIDAISLLKTGLSDPDPFVSVSSAIVLAEIKQYQDAFPTLKERLNDPDKYVRMAALRGLAYIGNENAIQLIRKMQNDPEKLVRERSDRILKTSGLN